MKIVLPILCLVLLMSSAIHCQSENAQELALTLAERRGLGDKSSLDTLDADGELTYPKYDSYVFATEWTGSICRSRKCNAGRPAVKNIFNVHGLWPNDKVESPMDCTSDSISYSGLSDELRNMVDKYWNPLYSGSQFFLNHEWTKHGTCWDPSPERMSSVPNEVTGFLQTAISSNGKVSALQEAYIRTTVALAQKYNAFNALSSSGILPHATKKIARNDIVNALQSFFNVNNFIMTCVKNQSTGDSMIGEVRVCLDRNYNVIECAKPNIQCAAQILYPEWI
jgi:ribonuclease I